MTNESSIPKVGTTLRGRVVQLRAYGAVIDIGGGWTGLLHGSQLSWLNKRARVAETLNVGDELDVAVLEVKRSKKSGAVFLSLGHRQTQHNPWETVGAALPIGSRLRAKVVDFLPFGATVEFASGFRALVHDSEVSWTEPRPKAHNLLKMGDEIDVVILTVDKNKRKIHASHRQAADDPWPIIEQRHPVGRRMRCSVAELHSYGASVELESGLRALLHNSEVSWTGWKLKAEDVLRVGDSVEVVLMRVDREKRRIDVSYRQALENPWTSLHQAYPIGTTVSGEVVAKSGFGLFVTLPNGCVGILHNSDIPANHPALSPGDAVRVVLLDCQPDERRMRLACETRSASAAGAGECD